MMLMTNLLTHGFEVRQDARYFRILQDMEMTLVVG
jgi:hypothetical protein